MLKPKILATVLAMITGAPAMAAELVLSSSDRFCLVPPAGLVLAGCRAEKFPGQFYYTALCPDPDDPDAADRQLLITDPSIVVMEGSEGCPHVLTDPTEIVFQPGGYRSEKDITAVQEPSQNLVRVLFGTNRKAVTVDKRVVFTGERDKELHLGIMGISVPTSHEKGKIERPWSFTIPLTSLTIAFSEDPASHFSVRWQEQVTPAIFKQQLRDAVANSLTPDQRKQAFVFVHGYNVSFEAAAFRTAQMAYDMEFNGAPIFYSWPSRGDLEDYLYDKDSVRQTRDYLAAFLRLIRQESGAEVIHLIAHSMGNDPLLEALRDLGDRRNAAESGFGEVILASPDLAVDDFEERVKHVGGLAQGFTLYANGRDRALLASKSLWGGIQRAGDLPALVMAGIDTIDVTSIGSDMLALNHSTYADNSLLLNDMALLFLRHLRPPSFRNTAIVPIGQSTSIYWQFNPG